MTTLDTSEEITQNVLRRALGLHADRSYIWDGRDLHAPCETCGHQTPLAAPPRLPEGAPVVDVVADPSALHSAATTVRMLVDVLDQRRPQDQLRELAHPRVLRYLKALPCDALGSHGGARLLSLRAAQPHEGSVEVAASVRLRNRRRALAASFELGRDYRWRCQTLRVM